MKAETLEEWLAINTACLNEASAALKNDKLDAAARLKLCTVMEEMVTERKNLLDQLLKTEEPDWSKEQQRQRHRAATTGHIALMDALGQSYADTDGDSLFYARAETGVVGEFHGGVYDRMVAFRWRLGDYLKKRGLSIGSLEPFAPQPNSPNTHGGLAIYSKHTRFTLQLHCLIIEGKEGLGAATGWSYAQLVASYAKMVAAQSESPCVTQTATPVLGLEVVGNHFGVVALALTDKVIAEPLTSYIHLHEVRSGQPEYARELLQVLHAFAIAVKELKEFYDEFLQKNAQGSLPAIDPDRKEQALPYLMQRRYQTVEQVKPGRNVWLATCESAEQRIVKVGKGSYDVELHEELAQAGVAPPLTHFERGDGGVYLVEVGYLDPLEGWTRLDQAKIEDWAGAIKKLEEAVGKLHQACGGTAVHGDLRGPNILVRVQEGSVAEVQLIDLSQAGRQNSTRYSYYLNQKINWPVAKPDGRLIMQEHDKQLLRTTIDKYQRPKSSMARMCCCASRCSSATLRPHPTYRPAPFRRCSLMMGRG
ncbi:hypothetical protein WJX73_003597 [Symbiochloris irregularis]|uniref:Protein kinase domain-containing protein n=1 Tax=Symbiochloris irregularis TaxID=706552 RepID=A0AAW1NSU4_9CHLO